MLQVTLSEILDMIGDEVIAELVDIPNDEARAHYPLERNTVNSYQEFHEEITMYYMHHLQQVIGSPAMPPHMASGFAREMIDQASPL